MIRNIKILRVCIYSFCVFVIISLATPASTTELKEKLIDLESASPGLAILDLSIPTESLDLKNIYFQDIKGEKFTLKDFEEPILALHFWATWCAPCRSELPTLDILQGALEHDKFKVITISIDVGSSKKIIEFYENSNINNLTLFRDDDMSASRQLRINGIPTTILVGPKNKEIARVIGDRDWSKPDVIKLFHDLIN
tara:strand:- start:488 stop:1078 length:591 start_codon:yes stop_codon:yes gene_type:complete